MAHTLALYLMAMNVHHTHSCSVLNGHECTYSPADALLPRNFDEGVLNTLASAVFFNQSEILMKVIKNRRLLDEV